MPSAFPASFAFSALADRLARSSVFADWGCACPSRVDSTNRLVRDMARERLAAGKTPHSLAVAEEQTAGRGRRGRPWQSRAGAGLWFSLILPSPEARSVAPPALVLAGALADRLAGAGVPVSVKWPNDLFLDEGKIGGLLMERLTLGGRRLWVAGVGINWQPPDRDLPDDYPGAGIGAWLDPGIDAAEWAEALIETAVRVLGDPSRWGGIMAGLERRHWLYRQIVRVEPGRGGHYRAKAGAIRPDGRLELILPGGGLRLSGPNDRVRPLGRAEGAGDETTREFQRQ
jgi:BirA family biotin operon repressor/biotin-[acetyl-CoA-carboxylase] ligase